MPTKGLAGFSDRLREARTERRYSQRELAKRAGVTGSALSQWESGDINPENIKQSVLRLVCRELGVRAEWLLTGSMPKAPVGGVAETMEFSGASLASQDTRMLPLVSMVQAGLGRDIVDAYPRGQGQEAIGVDAELAKQLSRVAFALKIEGDSMSPEFQPDDVVIIDPEVAPLPGDYVVAKLDGDSRATFKKYRNRGTAANGTPIFELVPLNVDYATILVNEENPG